MLSTSSSSMSSGGSIAMPRLYRRAAGYAGRSPTLASSARASRSWRPDVQSPIGSGREVEQGRVFEPRDRPHRERRLDPGVGVGRRPDRVMGGAHPAEPLPAPRHVADQPRAEGHEREEQREDDRDDRDELLELGARARRSADRRRRTRRSQGRAPGCRRSAAPPASRRGCGRPRSCFAALVDGPADAVEPDRGTGTAARRGCPRRRPR